MPREEGGRAPGKGRTDEEIWQLLATRICNTNFWRFGPGEAERLATVHMLHYLSGASAAETGKKQSATPDAPVDAEEQPTGDSKGNRTPRATPSETEEEDSSQE